MSKNTSKIISEQNDLFRQNIGLINRNSNIPKGKFIITHGLSNLDELTIAEAIYRIRRYNNFNQDNDPYGEHDLGKLRVNMNDILWKIDYYDVNYEYGSEDPSNLKKTRRVLTAMLSHEY